MTLTDAIAAAQTLLSDPLVATAVGVGIVGGLFKMVLVGFRRGTS